MTTTATSVGPEVRERDGLVGAVEPSPGGPVDAAEAAALATPSTIPGPRFLHLLRFSQRQIEFVFRARRDFGEVFRMRGAIPGDPVITAHPDHVRSLFTANPEQAPSLTAESPLRPIVGSNSVLTAIGPRHLRQRKLLLPPFHGEAIASYAEMISAATESEVDRWPVGTPFALAPRMQAVTLDVIMAGIFGIDRRSTGAADHGLRQGVKRFVGLSTTPLAQLSELLNIGRTEAVGMLRTALSIIDEPTYALIAERRQAGDLAERRDILSLLMQARTEEGEALSDKELRDELLSLVLAGHETTANQLAWTWERLLRNSVAHDRLREAVRAGGDGAEETIEATIVESMRSRPVIPMIGRRVKVPWRLGEYGLPAETPISTSILLLHHREDLYPRPFDFLPERWLGRKPGTYEWIPFGGGTRRCLGAALAMAEQRVVLEAMARRLDLEAEDPAPERARHRNVTMIPARGARVVVRSRRN